MTVAGTRPEIIRLAAVMRLLDATEGIDHVLVHTGQNWDHRLNGIFFEELSLRMPDHVMDVDVSSLGATLGGVLQKTEILIEQERPDAFLVLGDTNSAISILMAKRMHVPTYHMEAGNRSFDSNVPEEINRRLVDHTADFNLVYTQHARQNLLGEGIHPRRILLTGSPMTEVLDVYASQIEESNALQCMDLTPQGYFLASAHRQENVDEPRRLQALIESLNSVADTWGLPVLVSTHPRTRNRMESLDLSAHPLVQFHPPFGFLDYVRLQKSAACVLSDSGTISEESSILGFPAVTLRSAIERPEALDTGSIVMTDLEPATVLAGVEFAMKRPGPVDVPEDYRVRNTSERVVNFMLSTYHQHKQWTGLR